MRNHRKTYPTKQTNYVFGYIVGFMLLASSFVFYSKDINTVEDLACDFFDLISREKYLEAFRYVDDSKIKIEDLDGLGPLAVRYRSGPYRGSFITYMDCSKGRENLYTVGCKNVSNDDEVGEFECDVAKVNGEWKIIHINAYWDKPPNVQPDPGDSMMKFEKL